MGPKRHAPAAERNKEPIAEVLARLLPEAGTVLEVASGSGQHAVHFARRFPHVTWQPTDPQPDAVASIEAWRAEGELANLRKPMLLDARSTDWPVGAMDAVVCINMIHIAPWEAALGLFVGAASRLPAGAPLILYGPFTVDHQPTAPSNAAFDEGLRAQDPTWGVRDVADVTEAAAKVGLTFDERVEMPANNMLLVFRKA